MVIYQYEENADNDWSSLGRRCQSHSSLTTRGSGKAKQSDDGTHSKTHLMRGYGKGGSSEADSEKGSTITIFARAEGWGAC